MMHREAFNSGGGALIIASVTVRDMGLAWQYKSAAGIAAS